MVAPAPASSVRYLQRPEGQLAYDDLPAAVTTGSESESGRVRTIVCVPGMGDLRQSTRFIAPLLSAAGYRVITLDNRGHGASSVGGWTDYSPAAIGSDIVALLIELDLRQAVLMGNSMAAAACIWAAAECSNAVGDGDGEGDRDRVSALVLTGPFVRDIPINPLLSSLINALLWKPWGVAFWSIFYKSLFKAAAPADLDEYTTKLTANLREPGRLGALQAMMAASKAVCEARIPELRTKTKGKGKDVDVDVLVLMGTKDPDFSDPAAEADHIRAAFGGEASVVMIEGAGHYPHVEFPEQVLAAIKALK